MSALAKEAREKMKAKARSLASERVQKVDSSDWTPAEPLEADVKTGLRPISKRQFKRGGKVIGKAAGEASAARSDRKPRKAGGRVESEKAEAKEYANAKVNRDVRAANEEREGKKHVGGFKAGGKAKRASGGGVKDKQALGAIDPSPKRGAAQHYKKGGKIKKDDGGIVSKLDRLTGYKSPAKKLEEGLKDVGKQQTSNYSQEDKGALNRMLRKDDALPAPAEAMERSGKFQDYKRGGKAKRATGGRMDDDYVGAASVTKGGKPVTRPKDIEDREPREPRASDLYSGEQLKRLERGYGKGGKAKRVARATGGPIDIADMKKPKKASKAGRTDININIVTKPQGGDMGGLPPAPPMPMGLPIPMGGPAGGGAPAGAPPMAAPPPAPPMAPPGPAPRKSGGRVGKFGGGGMGFKGAQTGSAQPNQNQQMAMMQALAAQRAQAGAPGGMGFKGAQTGAGAMPSQSAATPPMSPEALQMMQGLAQNRGNPVNTFPGPQAPATQQQAMQQFRPGAPINIAGPGIQPTQNLQIRPGATAPVRPTLPAQQAAAPAAATPAKPQGPSAADQAAAVMRNMYVARAMGLMRKRGGRVK